jgi:riboflavin biosynthesis pyrimidine reductase
VGAQRIDPHGLTVVDRWMPLVSAGSARGWVQTLIEHDLVDEFRVMIDPLVVGGGKRIFRDDGVLRPLRLLDSQVTTTGAIVATYAPAKG